MADRTRIGALVLALAAALTGCDADSVGDAVAEADRGVVYGVGDEHALWRWEVGTDRIEPVLDLSGAWEGEGDVGAVLQSSLSIAPDQRNAAWIAGGSDEAELMFGDLASGETEAAVGYPLDHACLDPTWLADGSSLLVHRADVWGEPQEGDAMPRPAESWGPTEWYSPEVGALPTTVDLGEGCRLRWYTNADGAAEGVYRSLDLTELRRVDDTGSTIETIRVADLPGVEPEVIDLVDVDPSGRYACLADGYTEHESYEGGFTARPQEGTNVIDLESGESVGEPGSTCMSMGADGYLTREDTTVRFIDYAGEQLWRAELPEEIADSPNLFHFVA